MLYLETFFRSFSRISLLVLLAGGILTGCGGANVKLANYVPPTIHDKVLKQDVSDISLAYVAFIGDHMTPLSISINDLSIATHYKGYARIPLYPGEYVLKVQADGHSAKELPFNVEKGESVYFELDGMWIWSPYAQISENVFFVEERGSDEYIRTKQIGIQTRYQDFLPEDKQALVSNCLKKDSFNACDRVYQEIPLSLIDATSRAYISSLIETTRKKQAAEVAQKALDASLPKDVLRDKYMLALSDALSNKQFDKAIPVFEKIQNMQMPLDPDFYYFYGEALYETGKKEEALRVISKYIRTNGKQAQFYQESLQLLNKIQALM